MTYLETLAQREPWRRNIGVATTPLQAGWSPGVHNAPCGGDIEFEDGQSKWWFCKTCGFIGSTSMRYHHAPQHPTTLFVNALCQYMAAKVTKKERQPVQTSIHQALYVASVVLTQLSQPWERPGDCALRVQADA